MTDKKKKKKNIKKYLKGYARHASINLGGAARDLRHLHKYPDKKGGNLSTKDSIKKRLKSAASNLYYAGMPPSELTVGRHTLMKGHHPVEEVYELADNPDEGVIRSFKKSYYWKRGQPNK